MPSSLSTYSGFLLFHQIGLIVVSLAAVSQAMCRFPDDWSGQWFQSGVRQTINIDGELLSYKGTCIESEGDKFLIEDKNENCVRCVVIHKKHQNVLQYKETYCDAPDSLEEICSHINGDAPLFTMFRVNGLPETCPFTGPFTFIYNRGHGECHNPVSSVDSCTEDFRLLFRYQACPDVSGTESTAEELVCLATWKEGSTRFLVGKLEHGLATTPEDKYRCFIYEELEDETGFQVAQSGDATCIGLFSPIEGSRTMRLTRTNSLFSSCEFPDWMTSHSQWHSLDRRKIYVFDLSTNTSFNVTKPDADTPEMQVSCVESKVSHDRRAVMVLHATIGCHNGYICAVFHKRREHVIEFQRGSLATLIEEACTKHHFDEETAEFVTLLTEKPSSGRCPRLGKYNVIGMQPHTGNQLQISHPPPPPPAPGYRDVHCKTITEIHVGCNEIDLIEFHPDCQSQPDPIIYRCHGSWQENGTHYLITSLRGAMSRFCFVSTDLI
ncbi:hypothetical protein CHUAL_009382 [Chamberlinius hualienensis]